MSVFENLILDHGEKHLAKYRQSAVYARAEFLREYESYLPEIQRYYTEAGFWHGTGHYHYLNANDSRYENAAKDRVLNIFESILAKGGLSNHEDLWYNDGQSIKTVSVAPLRMHARMYAHIHLLEGVWLKYVFGGTRFWMGIFIALAAKELCTKLTKQKRSFLKQALFNKKSFRSFRIWASAVRNCDEFRILPLWRAYDLRSDIPGNHAVLFGIKRSAIQGEGVIPFIKNFEIRVARSISLDEMTHVEVPIENVAAIKKLLETNGVRLPVVPLEFGELYCAQFPFQKLVYA
jgi:hypothetical protein